MASVNKVIVLGNLGQDPELRYTQNQTPVVTLSIATTDVRNMPDGSRQENTEWHRVVVWGRQAENCAKYLTKGSSAYVEGRLQTRSWEDQSGQKRYSTEIVAQMVQFLRTNRSAAGGEWNQQQDNQAQQNFGGMNNPPFQKQPATAGNGQNVPDMNAPAMDDDIPF